MRAALDVLIRVDDENSGRTEYYFDEHRSVSYRSNWKLKTKSGAFERQRRETIQYLTDLRAQIDEVIARLEAAEPDENFGVQAWASVYEKSKGAGDE